MSVYLIPIGIALLIPLSMFSDWLERNTYELQEGELFPDFRLWIRTRCNDRIVFIIKLPSYKWGHIYYKDCNGWLRAAWVSRPERTGIEWFSE